MGKTKKHDKKSKKKHKHKAHKNKQKLRKTKLKKVEEQKNLESGSGSDTSGNGFEIPVELMNSKSHAPITPEEHERKQKQIRRVTDPTTGRTRLIKGDGEILEEIVSKKQHMKINKAATKGDGEFFQTNTVGPTAKQKLKK